MPIYEETYQSWQGTTLSRPNTWWIIGKTGIRLLWKKQILFFLFAAYIPFLVKAVQIYIVTRMGAKGALLTQAAPSFKTDPKFFLDFMEGQMLFIILILIFAGTGLIAKDKKYKAFSIYFAKPLNFWDYLGGKLLIIGFYCSLITLVPGLLLFLTKILFSPDAVFFNTYYWIPLAMIGCMLLIILSMGGLALAFSAAASSFRSAGIIFFGILTFPELVRKIFPGIKALVNLSLQANLKQINSLLFNIDKPFNTEIWLSILILAVTMLFSYILLKSKIKPVEVVK